MKRILTALLITLAITGNSIAADFTEVRNDNHRSRWLKLGTLTCHAKTGIGLILGSYKTAECIYEGVDGEEMFYDAEFTRLGVDIGITNAQTIVWVVLAPGRRVDYSLEGTYVGASAEATVIAGAAANVLFGGFENSFALQPLSVGAQAGLNIAAGLTSVKLTALRTVD